MPTIKQLFDLCEKFNYQIGYYKYNLHHFKGSTISEDTNYFYLTKNNTIFQKISKLDINWKV